MIDTILNTLEILSKYGFIDIIFGAGIVTYIVRAVKSKTVNHIDGLEVIPSFILGPNFEIELRNLSQETLYVYRAYFTPGYEVDPGSWKLWKMANWFKKWTKGNFLTISSEEVRNHVGKYILTSFDKNGAEISPPFMEHRASIFYRLRLKDMPNDSEIVFDQKKIGKLTLLLVHGSQQRTFELQL